jgi:hypothetical protein
MMKIPIPRNANPANMPPTIPPISVLDNPGVVCGSAILV